MGGPLFLPEGYAERTNATTEGIASTGAESNQGTVTHIEHWSGRIDAQVKPKSIPMKLTMTDGAPLSPAYLKAIGAHQEALDQLTLARASGSQEWIDAAITRVRDCKARILETQ